MAVHIIADSTCDITQAEAARMGVQVLPLSIHFGEREYRDGVIFPRKNFTNCSPPAASCPPPVR